MVRSIKMNSPDGTAASRKRSASPKAQPKRIKPIVSGYTQFGVTNVAENETLHQKCLIITGDCPSFNNSGDDYVAITTTDAFSQKTGPQHWPTGGNNTWRAVVMLSTGVNKLSFRLWHAGGISGQCTLSVNYVSLTQTPPLHLAILVAKDSPLLVPCPPSKFGAISSAHSGLDAVITKFRMTAYMWQAVLAEEMRAKSGIRRSFRFEEEWAIDSTKQTNRHGPSATSTMDSIARVHILRSERTVEEMQNGGLPNHSEAWQRRHYGGRQLGPREMFAEALKAYGGPFAGTSRPLIAGLVLDAGCAPGFGTDGVDRHGTQPYDAPQLAMFGNANVYAWPRFTEEVVSCLLDEVAAPSSGSEGPHRTIGEVCQLSQGYGLDAVLCGLGIEANPEEGVSSSWKRMFVSDLTTRSGDAMWCSLQQMLRLQLSPQLQMPDDDFKLRDQDFRRAEINACALEETDDYGDDSDETRQILRLTCDAGFADISIIDSAGDILSHAGFTRWSSWFASPGKDYSINLSSLPRNAVHLEPAIARVIAGNGKVQDIAIQPLLKRLNRTHLPIPGSSLRLAKTSVRASNLDEYNDDIPDEIYRPWHFLLSHRNVITGEVRGLSYIDLRVGCCFDGIIVGYGDGHRADNRPWVDNDSFGGHASEIQTQLRPDIEIAKVELNNPQRGHGLDGIRITLSSGVAFGALNSRGRSEPDEDTMTLAPAPGEKVVGLFGRSDRNCGYVHEFGILTMPAGAQLPDAAHNMPEFQRNGQGGRGYNHDEEMDEEDEGGEQSEAEESEGTER